MIRLPYVLMFILFITSIPVVMGLGQEDVNYVSTFFSTSQFCSGSFVATVVADNQGPQTEIYAHITNNELGVDAYSPIHQASSGDLTSLVFVEPLVLPEEGFLAGEYAFEVELFTNGMIRTYPVMLSFEGCPNHKNTLPTFSSPVSFSSNSRVAVEPVIAQDSSVRVTWRFSTILLFFLALLVLVLMFTFIIRSFLRLQ